MRPGARTGYEGFPGGEFVSAGIDDLRAGRETTHAVLVTMAAPRLRQVGVDVPDVGTDEFPHHRLYELLEAAEPATAHRRYNALVGPIVSFARAAEHARGG